MAHHRLIDPARLAAVRSLAILDTPPEPEFDDLAQIAAAIVRAPAAAIDVVDAERHFTKAAAGTAAPAGRSVPARRSLAAATVAAHDGWLVIPDARSRPEAEADAEAGVGFYAGATIRHLGQPVAVVCAWGPEPREVAPAELEALLALARQAGVHLELRRRNEEWREEASTDALTGLANRRRLLESLEIALAERRMGDDQVGLLFCDVDAFKSVNDRFGHEAGDTLLRELGRRLRDAVRDTDVVARLAGDEFVVLCPRLAGAEALALTARRVRATCDVPVTGVPGALRLSVGAVIAADGESPESVLRRADVIMYADKSAHRPDGRGGAPAPATS